jgi:general secretion pathway protein G
MGRRDGEAGFTLIELMIVIVVIGVLATIAIPNYVRSLQASKEAVLKEDLHVLRQQIDAYTNDKEKAPQSLDDLVSAGYMKTIPMDPMTQSSTTWVTTTDDTVQSLDQTDSGISDVHSGSSQQGSDGRPYSEW